MYDINKFPERLHAIRKDRYRQYQENKDEKTKKYICCKSQEKLAEALGVERRAIISWEGGKSLPSLELVDKLCDILDCSIEYLLGTGDNPAISPVLKASHYSGISSEIISYGLEHNEYLDCLNYFMNPKNCSLLFNNITLSTWKKFWIAQELSDIKNPLKDEVIGIFNEFCAVMPFSEINLERYTQFLFEKLPENKLSLSVKHSDNKINLKASLTPIKYHEYISNSNLEYTEFIDYLAHHTYKPLLDKTMLELQKDKLAKEFIALFENYLSDIG